MQIKQENLKGSLSSNYQKREDELHKCNQKNKDKINAQRLMPISKGIRKQQQRNTCAIINEEKHQHMMSELYRQYHGRI